MSDFAKELKEGVRRVEGGNVIVPQGLWDAMIDALEGYGVTFWRLLRERKNGKCS